MWRFTLSASNLVPGDTNGYSDVFVYDRQTDTIERVSVASDGTQGNGDSYCALDQRRRPLCGVSLSSPATSSPAIPMGRDDIFVYDRQTHTIERVSLAADGTQGNGSSTAPSISADGRYVAFRLCRQQPRPRRYQWQRRHLRV